MTVVTDVEQPRSRAARTEFVNALLAALEAGRDLDLDLLATVGNEVAIRDQLGALVALAHDAAKPPTADGEPREEFPRHPEVQVRTLGGFAVLRAGKPVGPTEWRSKKARDLLKLLIARRGRPTPREVLIEKLWPEEDPLKCGNRLSVALSTVRAILDPERARPADHHVLADRYVVGLAHLRIDVEGFLRAASAALHAAGPDRLVTLQAAEALYTGDFLEDDLSQDWAVALREEARTAYVAITRKLAHTAAQQGQPDLAVRYFLRVLDRDSYDEEAHLRLVAVLIAAGRHGEARTRYRSYRDRMNELGVPPAPYPAPRDRDSPQAAATHSDRPATGGASS